MALGRPTDYSENIIQATQDYINQCVDTTEQVVIGESEKFTSYKEKTIVNLPCIEGLAVHLGVHRDTIYEWEKIHKEFSDTLHTLRSIQAQRLINMGLGGNYNPMIAKLILTKHGYADKQELEHSGGIKMETITGMVIK